MFFWDTIILIKWRQMMQNKKPPYLKVVLGDL